MNAYAAAVNRRSIRKFTKQTVNPHDLHKMIDSARLAPCGANLQSLKFAVITDEKTRKDMFAHIKYAGYLPDWDPMFDESPPAFIAVINDSAIRPADKSECDCGAAIMSMCLTAQDAGLATCWLGAIDREALRKLFNLDPQYDLMYLLAVGYADQKSEVCDIKDNDVKYYFNDDGELRVPKRTMDEVIIEL